MAVFRQEAFEDQELRVGSKKPALSLSKGPSSKATAVVARGAYWYDVSTEKGRERRWRLFSTDPLSTSLHYENLLTDNLTGVRKTLIPTPISPQEVRDDYSVI